MPVDEQEVDEALDKEVFDYILTKDDETKNPKDEKNDGKTETIVEFMEKMKNREAFGLNRIGPIVTTERWKIIKRYIQYESLEKFVMGKFLENKIVTDVKKREMNFRSRPKLVCNNLFGKIHFKH